MPNPLPLPRVIVELQPDGSLVIEQYLNGARHRTPLSDHFGMFDIKDALARQQSEINAQAARAAERKATEEAERHSRVIRDVEYHHGRQFAEKVFGGNIGLKPRQSPLAKNQAGAKAGPTSTNFAEVEDFI